MKNFSLEFDQIAFELSLWQEIQYHYQQKRKNNVMSVFDFELL